jgi:concanavalin A-like lectin/glucanase superfamily protein
MCKRLICLVSCVVVLALVGSASAELVGHWKLDETGGTTAVDSSDSGNDGTIQGDPTWVTGAIGGAMECDGDDSVDCGNILELTQGLTLMCWVNPTDFSGDHGFAGRDAAYALKSSSDHLRITTPGILDYDGNATVLENGAWQHVAASFVPNEDEGLIFYLNGIETERLTTTGMNAGSGPFQIGNNQWSQFFIGAIDEVRVYDHILTIEEIAVAMIGEGPELAGDPNPVDEAIDVPRDAVLAWTPGELAATHDVYLGTAFDDVNDASRAEPMDVLVSQGQSAATYDPDALEFGQTYFWRIDEVNAAPDNTIFKGNIWSFTMEPFAYAVADITATSNGSSETGVGPENTINGSGLNADDQHSTAAADMWLAVPGADPITVEYAFDRVYKLHEMLVWNYNVQFEVLLGFGIQNVTVEYSEDGVTWMSLGDIELAQATAQADYTANTAVDMAGVAAQYVRLTVNSGFGAMGQYGLSEVRFLYIPAHAREPQPADGADDASVEAALSWRAGRDATSHEVYLSTNGEAVIDGTALADAVGTPSFAPSDLQFGTTYYWKVNEVSGVETISSWEGDIWTFRTQEYAAIDDFESYTDDDGSRIYESWIDGWVNETGSTVGYLEAPFAEQSIVNSGSQSMPLAYDNSIAPFYSEAEKDLGSMDLTGNGADTLILHVRGVPPTLVERADGSILMGSTGNDIWGTADAFRLAYMRLSGNGSIVARVDSLVNTSGWAKGGVMIRDSLDAGSTHAMVVVTPGNGVSLQHRPTMNQASLSINEAGLTVPYWVKLTRTGDILTAERSEDGVSWVSITADAAASSVEISMGSDVYIGLALASNNGGASPTAAEFANVSTTGNVTGQWQLEDIGGQQQPSNDPESMYVVIEDGTGATAVVTSANADLTVTPSWQAWEIPLSTLSGVNLSSVSKVTIGIGDRDNPTAGGTGLIYIDDIGFGSAYTEPADVTAAGDAIQGVPNDGDWPGAETPDLAIDDDVNTKFLHFKGETEPTGFQVTPAVGSTVVTGLTLTTANDAVERDPIAFELYGSKDSIDGPYTLIASGDIVDFAGATAWERFTMTTTEISFENLMSYAHYQVLFPTVRDAGSANSMQIAEVELVGVVAP